LRDDLPDLIAHAEKNGQVCGLLTDGLKLIDKNYLDLLLQTGLDHILFLLQPENPKSWTALEKIMAEDIFVTAHLTLNQDNLALAGEALEQLAKFEVKSLSLTSADDMLRDTYDALRDKAAALGLTLKFDLPVPYSASNPVAYEATEAAIPEGAGKAWLYVEPDGDVLPAQGYSEKVLGNLLRDEWKQIYP
jgi:MoaA/NifB/PqqE/SkfB family radical SAM enzyme